MRVWLVVICPPLVKEYVLCLVTLVCCVAVWPLAFMLLVVGTTAIGGASAGSLRLGFSPLELRGKVVGLNDCSKLPELLMNLPPMDFADMVRDFWECIDLLKVVLAELLRVNVPFDLKGANLNVADSDAPNEVKLVGDGDRGPFFPCLDLLLLMV